MKSTKPGACIVNTFVDDSLPTTFQCESNAGDIMLCTVVDADGFGDIGARTVNSRIPKTSQYNF